MNRRRNQHALGGRLRQAGCHVGGKQRSAGMHRSADLHRQQHSRFEAIHMLRRHGADEVIRVIRRQAKRLYLAPCAGNQSAPRLCIRSRHAGAARSKNQGCNMLHCNERHRMLARIDLQIGWEVERALVAWLRAIADTDVIGTRVTHLRQNALSVIRRQHTSLPIDQRRAESHHETIAVVAKIDHMAPRRQTPRERVRFG